MDIAGRASFDEVVYRIISFWYKKQTSESKELVKPSDAESLVKEELLKSKRID